MSVSSFFSNSWSQLTKKLHLHLLIICGNLDSLKFTFICFSGFYRMQIAQWINEVSEYFRTYISSLVNCMWNRYCGNLDTLKFRFTQFSSFYENQRAQWINEVSEYFRISVSSFACNSWSQLTEKLSGMKLRLIFLGKGDGQCLKRTNKHSYWMESYRIWFWFMHKITSFSPVK